MTRTRLAVTALLALLAATVATPVAASARSVIVMGSDSAATAATVAEVGGDVDRMLDAVGGVSADVSEAEERALEAAGLVVVPDAEATVTSTGFDKQGRLVQLEALNPSTNGRDVGAGVGVALLDTGVAPSPEFGDRIIVGPDLSGEGDGVDRYGHGTFMAGLVVGAETGAAPGAHLVSVKVAGRDGSTSLSTVLDGIDWVVETRDEFDTRILSISLAVTPFAATRLDPLAVAAEYATANGVLVVAAAGNEAGAVTSPGIAPSALTVGATDPGDTANTSDDVVAAWSGSDGSKPEVVAPGAPAVSVRAPGSTIDEQYPAARIAATHFRGSGTSMATALTAGAAAVVAEQAPDATPAQLKSMLVNGAKTIAGGAKTIDLRGAEKVAAAMTAVPGDGTSTGTTGTSWTGTSWTGTRWAGTSWTGTRWAGTRWAGTRWAGTRWAGTRWAGTSWTGTRWAGTRWAGTRWAGTRWAASTFDAAAP